VAVASAGLYASRSHLAADR